MSFLALHRDCLRVVCTESETFRKVVLSLLWLPLRPSGEGYTWPENVATAGATTSLPVLFF